MPKKKLSTIRGRFRFERPLRVLNEQELLSEYHDGQRDFSFVKLNQARLAGARLSDITFLVSSLIDSDFTGANLSYVQFKGADLTGSRFIKATINGSDLIATNFTDVDMRGTDLTGSHLGNADCTRADMRRCLFNNVTLTRARFHETRVDEARLYHAHFCDVDVRTFCDARTLVHGGDSSVDARTVIQSYQHPGLKSFMTACGVPEIFATYMIDCARALGEPLLRALMQSTFISYGGPDEAFARKLYNALRSHGVVVFFFPESATLGERIDNEVFRRIQDNDRILLICSKDSLDRPGVLNEIQETLDREARDGGATYLLPVMLDDYVLTGWHAAQPELAERIGRRIIGDFSKAKRSKANFDTALERVIDALKRKRVT